MAGETVEVLIPIFDIACPEGDQGRATRARDPSPYAKSFHIEAFAQISVRGWHFIGGGNTYYTPEASALSSSLDLKNPDTGLFGTFIKKVTLAEAAAHGWPDNLRSHGRPAVQIATTTAMQVPNR